MNAVARILAEQDNRFPMLTINWCRKYVRSVDSRSILEGFGYAGEDSFDDDMQRIMRRNELDLHNSVNNIATLVTGVSYGMVSPRESDGAAVITIEDPASMAVERDPVTGEVIAAIKFWSSDPDKDDEDQSILHLPGKSGGSQLIRFEKKKQVDRKTMSWMSGPAKMQGSGTIPVVEFLNQPRWGKPTSQLVDLMPIVDSANFVAVSMMATVLHHAMPRMLAINVAESHFFNEDGTLNREAVKNATGSLWIIPAETDDEGEVLAKPDMPKPDVKQLPPSDLRNFHDTLSQLARIGSGLCDLAPTDFGFGISDNPASEKSIEASKRERMLGIERFNRQQGAGYARLMRYALAVENKSAEDKVIEARHRNPATPTKQSMADAAVKTYSEGISDLYQARLDYGYTPNEIRAMEERERTAERERGAGLERIMRPTSPSQMPDESEQDAEAF